MILSLQSLWFCACSKVYALLILLTFTRTRQFPPFLINNTLTEQLCVIIFQLGLYDA